MKFTEIKLQKDTLPEDDQKVEFEVLGLEGEFLKGIYHAEEFMFWVNERTWHSAWVVLKWRGVENDI